MTDYLQLATCDYPEHVLSIAPPSTPGSNASWA